tara:strand:- start:62 stop:2548 length:2487 start_codon:yes stop_codon:yes gene_type:complete
MDIDKYLSLGVEKKLISIDYDNDKIIYEELNKSYKFSDPEEKVRASIYIILIEKYKYSPDVIELEVAVPRRTPNDSADIVVFTDTTKKQSHIVVEAKKEGVSQSEFLQAIEQGFGNANSLRSAYLLVSDFQKNSFYNILDFPPSERKDNQIQDLPINYGLIPKYLFKKKKKDLEEVSFEKLSSIFESCHDIIWSGGKLDPSKAFDEMSKLLFAKILDEMNTKNFEIYKFQVGSNENDVIVSQRIIELYEKAKELDPAVFDKNIDISYSKIFQVVKLLQHISLSETDIDAKGQAFEKFLGVVFRGGLGQYFTRRQIVEFTVEFLEPKEDDVILDPSCGSGGFLLYSFRRVIKNIEKNYKGNNELISRKKYNFCSKNIFGIEINDKISRVSKMDMVINGDGHTNIETGTGLNNTYNTKNLEYGNFSLILSNPPFGVKIKKGNRDDLGSNSFDNFIFGEGKQKVDSDILFMEQYHNFLTNESEKNPRIGVVMQTGLVNNPSNKKLIDWIKRSFKILGVVNLPIFAFRKAGSGMKTVILFLKKYSNQYDSVDDVPNYKTFFAFANHIGYDSTLRPDKNELNDILNSYRNNESSNNCFWKNFNELEYRIDPLYYKNKIEIKKQLDDLSNVKGIEIVQLSSLLKSHRNNVEIAGKSPLGGVRYSIGEFPSITVSNITREGNINFNDVNFVPKSFFNKFNESKGNLLEGDLLIAKDGATTGKTAIVKKEHTESIFSEHVFRLRLKDDIMPLYIHAFLNSTLGRLQMETVISGGAQGGITQGFSKDIFIPIIKNQKGVVKFWEKETANLLKLQNNFIEKSEFIKKAIINKIIDESI